MSPNEPAAKTNESTRGTGIPVLPPVMALIEILALIALPTVLDYSIPSFPKLSEFQPHPFWLPVLLVSLQYGTVSGLLAAGVAIGASAFLGWPDQEVGENHFNYLLRIWAEPVLWLGVALVLGQFRNRQIERKLGLIRQVAELSSQRSALSEYATNLRVRCDQLERAFAVRQVPEAQAALAALGCLAATRVDNTEKALAEALTAAYGPCEASVFLLNGKDLQVAIRHNWQDATAHRTVFAPTDALWHALVQERRGLCVLNPGDEHDLDGEGLAVTPMFSNEGDLIGALKLEHLPATRLDMATLPSLAAISSVLADVIGRRGSAGALSTSASAAPQSAMPRAHAWRHLRRVTRSLPAAASAEVSKTGAS